MKVSDAMRNRHSCRAFLAREVDSATIEHILEAASRAPSGGNLQPWRVAVVTAKTKVAIEQKMVAQYLAGNRGKAEFQYYPTQWQEPYKSRRFACGMQLYSALGIERDDQERRTAQWLENYRAFGAPVVLYFYMESCLEVGSYMDFGMFLQAVMLLAEEEGLATCPQASLAEYPGVVKHELGLRDGYILLCGMAMGYEDADAPVNQYRTPRAEPEDFVKYYC